MTAHISLRYSCRLRWHMLTGGGVYDMLLRSNILTRNAGWICKWFIQERFLVYRERWIEFKLSRG